MLYKRLANGKVLDIGRLLVGGLFLFVITPYSLFVFIGLLIAGQTELPAVATFGIVIIIFSIVGIILAVKSVRDEPSMSLRKALGRA